MILFDGYSSIEEYYNGIERAIYLATRNSDKLKVVLKLLKLEYPDSFDIKKIKTEYDILKKLDIPGVIKSYDLIKYKNSFAIIMEYFEGASLETLINSRPLAVKEFLSLAIKLVIILGEIHKKNVIHKDIKPHHILINKENNDLRIIDFSIASQISKEIQTIINPETLEGTLNYISPEQTGRMNRSIDYRSDYYSLGITFYQLLTGILPFDSDDPIEIVHNHIAKIPIEPAVINSNIPPVISKIIMKLISKTAESRYQSVSGLNFDLERCLNEILMTGFISDFEIGKNDISGKIQIPEKLYGREKETDLLINVLNNTSGGEKEIHFFTGSAGIGKSVLINEIQKLVVEKRGYFISGKYDQFKRNIPFSAIIDSFRDLARQIISEPDDKILIWEKEILQSIGNNGRVIIDVIPEIELIIGKQPELPELPSVETQNRFNSVFESFIKVFTGENHPLILFLDDLQWSDNGSIKLLDLILTDQYLKYFLFIGAYRHNELDSAHQLNLLFEKMNKNRIKYDIHHLEPLKIEDIRELLSDTLQCDQKLTSDFAEIIYIKCAGNPFFISQFINTLHDEKILKFINGWLWDISKIKEMRMTENVIDLMAEKINRFEKKSIEIIKVASCIGMTFNLLLISKIVKKNIEEIFGLLTDAINYGILVKINDDLKFIHDKVRESAYLLIEDEYKKELHYESGKILLAEFEQSNNDDLIFDIVNHLNISKDLLSDKEKNKLIILSLKAGLKAKLSTAYDSALNYLINGMDILDNSSWNTDYDLCLNIYTERAELEYLNNHFSKADHYFEIILDKTKNELDNLKIYELKILSLSARLKLKEAISYGIDVLKKYGIKLTKKPGQISALPEIIKANIKIGNKDPMDLLNLPEMTDPYIKASIRILMTISPLCYLVYTDYVPLITMKLVNLSLKYGNCNSSAFGYAIYGFIKCGLFYDMKNGNKFGQLALKLIDKYDDKFLRSEVDYAVGAFIIHWTNHLKNVDSILFEGYQNSLETGNMSYAGYNLDDYFSSKFIIGENLLELNNLFNNYISIIYKTNVESAILYLEPYRQATINLLTENNNTILIGEAYNEELNVPRLLIANNTICLAAYYHVKILLCYIFEEFKVGFEIYKKGKSIIKTAFAKYQQPEFYFYFSLIYFSLFNELDKKEKNKFFKEIKKIIKLFKIWSKFSPENYLHKLLLINAELAKIKGNDKEAMELYDQSIKSAKKNDYINIEAIANECAVKYYLSRNFEKIALSYLLDARYCYTKWGAMAKVKELEIKYKNILDSYFETNTLYSNMMSKNVQHTKKSKSDTWSGDASILDINTVIKATLTLSGEIEMKKLLKQLINILIINAGAQKCCLILIKEDSYYVEAEGEVNKETNNILLSIPIDKHENLSKSIVRYVIKTRENIILNDAAKDGLFTNDEYIIKNNSKSILSIPVINQGKVIGAVYLENNLTSGAFTSNRIELVKIISSQAAISIENARLILEMRDKERLKKEMEIAKRIQTALIPITPDDNEFEITAYMKPAEEVGGDYYDIIYDGENRLWFAIGDVSGHGVTPGLIMMMAQTAFNNQLDGNKNQYPKNILNSINKILCKNVRLKLKESHFMTMTILKYQGNGKFIFSGSHLDIIVYRNKTNSIERIKTEGVFLSVLPDILDKIKNSELFLDVNDIMVLYTDGIIESRNKNDRNKLWGMSNLCNTIEENAGKNIESIKDEIINQVFNWCENKLDDDITLLMVKRKI